MKTGSGRPDYDLARPPPDERAAIFAGIQTVTAGRSAHAVITALLDSAAIAMAFAATDRESLDATIEALVPDMRKTAHDNWDYARAMRARPGDAGHA